MRRYLPSCTLNYWDIGVRGDTGPNNHSSGFTFTPRAVDSSPMQAAILEANAGFRSQLGIQSDRCPPVLQRFASAAGGLVGRGLVQVPPGTNEANVPVPVFNLTAGATVDEGNNWINISWGPLSMTSPVYGGCTG